MRSGYAIYSVFTLGVTGRREALDEMSFEKASYFNSGHAIFTPHWCDWQASPQNNLHCLQDGLFIQNDEAGDEASSHSAAFSLTGLKRF